MYEQLFVISQFDLLNFGCPHCGCANGEVFVSWNSVSLWCCDDCAKEIAVVKDNLEEVLQVQIRNTDIQDLIGKHPYRDIAVPKLRPYTLLLN